MLDVLESVPVQIPPLRLVETDAPRGKRSPAITVAVAIPAYNEERFIGSTVLQALQYASNVVVIDDGSSDATAQIARWAGARVLQHETNRGKSEAVNTALAWARAHNIEALVLVDGDGQHKPEEIGAVLDPVLHGEADIVIGSRFLSIKSNIPTYRTFGQHALTAVTNFASSVPVTDSQSGFRAFSSKALEVMYFTGKGLSVESEMQFHAKTHQLAIKEVPISVVYAEKAKRNPFAHGMQVVMNIIKLVGQHRPLMFFGLLGLLMMAGALFTLTISVGDYMAASVLPLGMMMLTGMLLILSLFCWGVGLVLHSVRSGFVELRQVMQRDRSVPLR